MLTAVTLTVILSACKKEADTATGMPDVVVKPDQVFYAITAASQLAKFNAKSPETPETAVTITNLQPGETILGIDFRPATGELYGVGSTSRLYIINLASGAARVVGSAPFTPAINGTSVGFDFNPTVDRIRLVTNAGQNLRLNPETGTVAATDGSINGVSGATVSAVAYTNSKAGAGTTSLFDIDFTTLKLYKQTPPNNGTLAEVGALGIMDVTDGSFDISPDNSVALASFSMNGSSALYIIDTATGKASKLGMLGSSSPVTAIAIPTNAVAYANDESNNFYIFNPTTTDAPVIKTITGLQPGEKLHGIDFRPLNGQIFALGSGYNLYTLNAATGAATIVGTGSFGILTGSSFGFDFNPTVDRIRVVSSSGQNLRLNPITGAIAATDVSLNPCTPNATGAAYTNNFAGAASTVLYDIDCIVDKLFKQTPPNDGTLVEVGSLGINIEPYNGFDIGSTSGKAYGLFTVGADHGIYTIDLTTGAATKLVSFPFKATGFTIGLGF